MLRYHWLWCGQSKANLKAFLKVFIKPQEDTAAVLCFVWFFLWIFFVDVHYKLNSVISVPKQTTRDLIHFNWELPQNYHNHTVDFSYSKEYAP